MSEHKTLIKTAVLSTISVAGIGLYSDSITEAQLYPTPKIVSLPTQKVKDYFTKYRLPGIFKSVSTSLTSTASNVLLLGAMSKFTRAEPYFSANVDNFFIGGLYLILSHPLEVIGLRYRHQSEKNDVGFLETIKNSYKNNGINSFFQGISFSLVENLVYFGSKYALSTLMNLKNDEETNSAKHLLVKLISSIIAYPISTLKTRRMMQYTVVDNQVAYNPNAEHLYSGVLESISSDLICYSLEKLY